MALVNSRDPDAIHKALLRWLQRQYSADTLITLPALSRPENGGSSDTLFLDPVIQSPEGTQTPRWVLRIEASDFQIYQNPCVGRQFHLLQALGQSGQVPVPDVLWHEEDATVLGAPFYLMERLHGEVPDGRHHSKGVLADATPPERHQMWVSALQTMAKVHQEDPARLAFLKPDTSISGLDHELAVWDAYALWSEAPLRPEQIAARQWLSAHMPAERPTGLAWGDARPANMVFHKNACVGVLDWETVSLAGAETDLGWWLMFDWLISEGSGQPRLDGIPPRDETMAIWSQAIGRQPAAMDWHEVFATWRYSLISDRARLLVRRLKGDDALPPETTNPVPSRLARLIAG